MTSSTTDAAQPPDGAAAQPHLLDVGRVAKPHGLAGEVVVELWTDRPERLAPGTELMTDTGSLRVNASRPHQGRHLVRFEGVPDRAAAERLRGQVLRAPPIEVDGALWVHQLVGARVVTPDGKGIGRVAAVEANPASDLLLLEGGALVPLRFVVAFEPGVQVTVDVPEGLVD